MKVWRVQISGALDNRVAKCEVVDYKNLPLDEQQLLLDSGTIEPKELLSFKDRIFQWFKNG